LKTARKVAQASLNSVAPRAGLELHLLAQLAGRRLDGWLVAGVAQSRRQLDELVP